MINKIDMPNSEQKDEGKKLNQEEIKELADGMNEYTQGLKIMIDEIEARLQIETDEKEILALNEKLIELKDEYGGLGEFVEVIEKGDFEEIIEKPVKE